MTIKLEPRAKWLFSKLKKLGEEGREEFLVELLISRTMKNQHIQEFAWYYLDLGTLGPPSATLEGILCLRMIYLIKGNKFKLPISLELSKGIANKKALVDSGAMENFIDYSTIKWLKLGTKWMDTLVLLRNIDGTTNQSGKITHYLNLVVLRGNKKIKEHFFISNLGKDQIIFGYPWLWDFNPQIDWAGQKLVGLPVKVCMLLHRQFPQLKQLMIEWWNIIPT